MTPFTYDQFVVAGLVFLLGLFIGVFIMAGGKWKRLYREEAARADALEAENNKLRRDEREMESLRNAAAKNPGPHPVDEPVRREDVDHG